MTHRSRPAALVLAAAVVIALVMAQFASPGSGAGNALFAPPRIYGLPTLTPAGPWALTVGRFRGSSSPVDLAVADSLSSDISVLLGIGDGSLATATSEPTLGGSPESIVNADFNSDGKLDLATSNAGGDTFSVAIGVGDGTFATPFVVRTQPSPQTLVAGDFNGDGKPDVIVSSVPFLGTGSVRYFPNDGSGGFATSTVIPTAVGKPYALATADFDSDGKLDLAVGNLGSSASTIQILRGNGNGSFQSPVDKTAGTDPRAIKVGDLDGDGKLDLAVANSGSNNVSILKGIGDGTFATATNYSVGAGVLPFSVAIGDFDKDGKPDLVTANASSNNLSLLYNAGDATFPTSSIVVPTVAATPVPEPRGVLAEDLNGDGFADLEVANKNSNNVSVLLNGSTSTALASSKNPSAPGEQVTFTAVVTYAGTTESGVRFTDNDMPLATRALTGVTSKAVTVSTKNLTVGTHRITASFIADATHTTSSATVEQVVGAPTSSTSSSTPPTTSTTTTLPAGISNGASSSSGNSSGASGSGSSSAGTTATTIQSTASGLARTGGWILQTAAAGAVLLGVGALLSRRRPE